MPPFSVRLPVRFDDVDHAGIVYFPRFFHFFHCAFEELWRERAGANAYAQLISRRKLGFPAVHASCEFRAPVRFGEQLDVTVRVLARGRTSVRFGYQAYRVRADEGRTLAAEGVVVAVVTDLANFVAVPAPADVLAVLADLDDAS